MEIKFNGSTVPLTARGSGLKVSDLINGVKLSELIGTGTAATLASHLSENQGRKDTWTIESKKFKFAANADVELIVTGAADKGLTDPFVVSTRSVEFEDLNKWDKYTGGIGVTQKETHTLELQFAHQVPTDLLKPTSMTATDKKSLLDKLFTPGWLTTSDTVEFVYENVAITKKGESSIAIEFKDGFIKDKATPPTPNLGYYLANVGKKYTVTNGTTNQSSTTTEDTIHLVFEKNKLNDGKQQIYSSKFVDATRFSEINGYKNLFKDFKVTFTEAQNGDNSKLELITDFGTIAATDERFLDARIQSNTTLTDSNEYKMKLYVNGTLTSKDSADTITIKGSELNTGIKLSKLLEQIFGSNTETRKQLKYYASGSSNNWRFVITQVQAPTTQRKFDVTVDLILGEKNVSTRQEELNITFPPTP